MRQKPITSSTRNQSRSFNDNNNNNNKNFSQETKKKIEHLIQIPESYLNLIILSKKQTNKIQRINHQRSNIKCNLSTSIHPYKTKHPPPQKKKKKRKIHKIQRNASISPFLLRNLKYDVITRPYNMYYSSLRHCAGKRVGEQSRPRHGCLLVRVTESRVTRVDYNWTSIYPFLLTHPEYVHTYVHIYNERRNRV